jgi:hypothetical protein
MKEIKVWIKAENRYRTLEAIDFEHNYQVWVNDDENKGNSRASHCRRGYKFSDCVLDMEAITRYINEAEGGKC